MKKVTKKMQGGKRVAILSSPLDPPSLQTRDKVWQGIEWFGQIGADGG